MPVMRITSQDAQGTTSAVYPANPTDGNTLIACVLSGVSAPSLTGWTTVDTISFNGGGMFLRVFALIANATPTTVTPGTGTIAFTHIYEYDGMSNLLIIDKVVQQAGTAITSLASTNLVTTNPNDLLLASVATSASVTSPAFTNNFNMNLTDTRLFDAESIVTATGTYSTTGSWTTSVAAGLVLIALQGSPIIGFNNYEFMKVGDGMSVSEKIR